MKKIVMAVFAAILCLSCSRTETFSGDPLGTQIYTLDNGLKVYMSVNKDAPRIQTYIAVRVGGKNDPSDNTGLAHYLEHLMFKGSEKLGTTDYAAEKPLLDSIEALYEVYRTISDDAQRRSIYHVIDSLSYQASNIAIANEYDKAMAIIGSKGSNAFTSNDVTCYVEDIPSNQIENWAKVQSDRFKNMVIRGFHTELEAVYEEFNMYLNDDGGNAMTAIDSVLFPHHPYGTQTVIGTQAHLKNPSISTIKKQKATYYVPNNTAICLSGDFEPKEMIRIIEKYFSDWKRTSDVPQLEIAAEEPITEPVVRNVYGTETEFVMIGWRYPGAASRDAECAEIVSSIISNNMAGILDIDLNQQQKVLSSSAFSYGRADWGEFLLEGLPKAGQSLEEVSGLLLAEVAKLRSGDFNDDLVEAAVSNYKLNEMRALERNSSRAMKYVDSFVNGTSWEDEIGRISRLEKLTKEDIVNWACTYLGENNYAVVYKRFGENPMANKIIAPAITPIETNRNSQSDFLTEIQNAQVSEIEPVWTDFAKEVTVTEPVEGVELIYKHNDNNDIAQLTMVWDKGIINDPALDLACDYIQYLGTSSLSSEQLALEMYKLACRFSISSSTTNTYVSISGLSENIGQALERVTDLMQNAIVDEDILSELKSDMFKSRKDAKSTQSACASALGNYLRYGPDFIRQTTITDRQLRSITASELVSKIAELCNCQHQVRFYSPASADECAELIREHQNSTTPLTPLKKSEIKAVLTPSAEVFIAPYDARQFTYTQFSNRGEVFNLEDRPGIRIFNEYFGGGMGSIVFQEMREARALAYSAGANLQAPSHLYDNYTFSARIGSQNDKLRAAVEAFDQIINEMPLSENGFAIAKASLLGQLRTSRISGSAVIDSYLSLRELGLSEHPDKCVFEQVQQMELEDIVEVQQKWVKDRTYHYSILGDWNDLDMNYLRSLGPVRKLSLEEIFGY